jgi:hypothetical protein
MTNERLEARTNSFEDKNGILRYIYICIYIYMYMTQKKEKID